MVSYYKKMKSPVGELTLIARDKLVAILWENDRSTHKQAHRLEAAKTHSVLLAAEKQLNEYFGGERQKFELPLELNGTTFQTKVWRSLLSVTYGSTRSYGYLAKEIGSPKACRAVGGAVSRNPLSIVVPCHRIIGTDGTLTGFAGGMKAKEFLLNLENAQKTL